MPMDARDRVLADDRWAVLTRACHAHGGEVDMRSWRDFSSFALPPRGAARFSSFASPAESHEHDLLAERAVAQAALFRFSSFVGPPRSEDLFAEARRAPALAALLGLRCEDLFM